MENIPSSFLIFFWNPFVIGHFAQSFNLEAHWVSFKSNQLGDFGTRMKRWRGPEGEFQS